MDVTGKVLVFAVVLTATSIIAASAPVSTCTKSQSGYVIFRIFARLHWGRESG
jgi:hypothetical protein